jgi:hypothetical protein
MTTKTMTRLLGLLSALAVAMPAAAQERVGVATTVLGPVTVTRVAASPTPLKFKDDVFLNDRVATGEQAFVRMLLGGKAIVTARERSVVTITEVPGLSTIDVVSGRISVAVDKSRMRPGELVEIKTPNAVSGIRGTIVVAEASAGVSTITVLRGLVDVYRRDPATGNAVGQATPVGVRETVTIKGGVLPGRPQVISVDQARQLSSDFTAPVQPVSSPETMVADEISRATALIGTLTGGTAAVKPDNSTSGATASAPSGVFATPALTPVTTLTASPAGATPSALGGAPAPIVSTAPVLSTPILATPQILSTPILATPQILSTPILATPTNPTISPTPTTSPAPILNLSPVLQPVTNLLKK